MAVEHLTRMNGCPGQGQINYVGGRNNQRCNFNTGYHSCLKAVFDYFQLVPTHSNTSVSVPHLISYLENRLAFEPVHHENDHRSSSCQDSPLQEVHHRHHQRPKSSCEFQGCSNSHLRELTSNVTAPSGSHVQQCERSGSPEKKHRSDEGHDQRPNSPTWSYSSPSPNLANLKIADSPLPVVDLVTSGESSTTGSDTDERRRRSTSFKKVLKERYLNGSKSEWTIFTNHSIFAIWWDKKTSCV